MQADPNRFDLTGVVLTYLDTSGQRPLWEEPTEFHDLMAAVLADTAPNRWP